MRALFPVSLSSLAAETTRLKRRMCILQWRACRCRLLHGELLRHLRALCRCRVFLSAYGFVGHLLPVCLSHVCATPYPLSSRAHAGGSQVPSPRWSETRPTTPTVRQSERGQRMSDISSLSACISVLGVELLGNLVTISCYLINRLSKKKERMSDRGCRTVDNRNVDRPITGISCNFLQFFFQEKTFAWHAVHCLQVPTALEVDSESHHSSPYFCRFPLASGPRTSTM